MESIYVYDIVVKLNNGVEQPVEEFSFTGAFEGMGDMDLDDIVRDEIRDRVNCDQVISFTYDRDEY